MLYSLIFVLRILWDLMALLIVKEIRDVILFFDKIHNDLHVLAREVYSQPVSTLQNV